MSNHLTLLRAQYAALVDLHKAAKGFRYGTSADHYFDEQSRRWKRKGPKKRKAKGSRGQTSPPGHSPHGARMGTFADFFESGEEASSWYDDASDKEIREMAASLGYPPGEDINVLRDSLGDDLTTAFPDQAE